MHIRYALQQCMEQSPTTGRQEGGKSVLDRRLWTASRTKAATTSFSGVGALDTGSSAVAEKSGLW